MDAIPLDTRHAIETPEGAELELRAAGLFVRALALAMDELIRWSMIFGAFFSLSVLLGGLGWGAFLLVLFLCYWLYPVAFEVWGNGMTPGKRVQQIRVVHADGTPVQLPASLLRNLLLVVDWLPFLYTGGIAAMVLSGRFQRLGDLAADTLVVYNERRRQVSHTVGVGADEQPLPLQPAEREAIMRFAERHVQLSPDRARELANILSPVLGERDDAAVAAVLRIANGIWGRS
jgi:uncharacterized RDD family membrane protein YckC